MLEFHHGSLGIARSLGRLGIKVYGVDRDPDVPGFLSRYCCRSFVWNLTGAPADESVAFLIQIAQEIGVGTVLIPTSDETVLLVAEHADELSKWFRFPRQRVDLVRSLASKREAYQLARSANVPVPHTDFPSSLDDVRALAPDLDYPVMVKGIDGGRLFERTGAKMAIARSQDGLIQHYEALDEPGHPNLMLQEFIPGDDDTIWIFNGYFDRDSKCLGSFTGRKLRQTPIHTGATSLGLCTQNDEVSKLTIDFMQAIGYQGILDIGFRFDARDHSYRLLDANPRIGSTFRLFTSQNDLDVARILYLDQTGQSVTTGPQREGRKWFIEDRDFESCLHYRREGSLGLGQWMASYKGVEEAAWFARDDMRPFWSVLRQMTHRVARWIGRKLRRESPANQTSAEPPRPTLR